MSVNGVRQELSYIAGTNLEELYLISHIATLSDEVAALGLGPRISRRSLRGKTYACLEKIHDSMESLHERTLAERKARADSASLAAYRESLAKDICNNFQTGTEIYLQGYGFGGESMSTLEAYSSLMRAVMPVVSEKLIEIENNPLLSSIEMYVNKVPIIATLSDEVAALGLYDDTEEKTEK